MSQNDSRLRLKCGNLQLENPFLLASGPPTAEGDFIRKAFGLGWGGAVTKTINPDNLEVADVSPRFGVVRGGDGAILGIREHRAHKQEAGGILADRGREAEKRVSPHGAHREHHGRPGEGLVANPRRSDGARRGGRPGAQFLLSPRHAGTGTRLGYRAGPGDHGNYHRLGQRGGQDTGHREIVA